MADTRHHSIWQGLKDRWEFAVQDKEQRFQTKLVTRRQFYNGLLSYPSNYIQNRLLRPDLPVKGLFDRAAAWSFVDKLVFGTSAGQIARSMTRGYERNELYTRAKDAATGLSGMALTLDAQSGEKLSDEIARGRGSVLNDMFNQSAEAGHTLEQFIAGKLPITPTNLEKLNMVFSGMAELAGKRAELLQSYQGLAQKPALAGEHKPADYIREVISKERLETPRDGQLFLGFVATLLADSAVPYSSEIFIPQEEVFLTPEQNSELSKAISARMKELGYRVNSAEEGQPLPAPQQPEGILLSASNQPLPPAEALAFANELHGQLMGLAKDKIDGLLNFADERFADIENQFLPQKIQESSFALTRPVIDVQSSAPMQATGLGNPMLDKAGLESGSSLSRDAGRALAASRSFLSRPHLKTEISKLFGRSVSNQVLAFPVNVFDEMLRNFFRTSKEGKPKAGFDILRDRLRGETQTEMAALMDMPTLKNNLKSRGFRIVAQSLIASVGVTYSQEGSRIASALATHTAEKTKPILHAAIARGQELVPEMAERMAAAGKPHPAFQAVLEKPQYKGKIAPLLAQDMATLAADDFQLMAQFFHEVSGATVQMASEVLSPFQPGQGRQQIQHMDEVAARLFAQPIDSVPDAMMALAFAQGFMQMSKDNIEMLDYVDPQGVIFKPKELKQLGYFIEDETKRLNLSVRDENGQPRLYEGNEPASAKTLVEFGNRVAAKTNEAVSIPMVLASMRGEFRDNVVRHMEDALFDGIHFETAPEAAAQQPAAAVDPVLLQPWCESAKRPDKKTFSVIRERWKDPEIRHEKKKLHDRMEGEVRTGAFSTLIQKSLQHQNSVFDRGNLTYTAWAIFAYPTVYGKGIINVREAWDEALFHKRSKMDDANLAVDYAAAALRTISQINPETEQELSQRTGSNLPLEELQNSKTYGDIARITAKAQAERSPQEMAALENYFQKNGDMLLQRAGGTLASLDTSRPQETFTQSITRVVSGSVGNLTDAAIALSFLASTIHSDATALDKQSYVDPKTILLDRKALAELSGFMDDQAFAAGFTVGDDGKGVLQAGSGAASEADVIRYANVSLQKFRDILGRNPQIASSFSRMASNPGQQVARKARETAGEHLR